MKFTNENEAFAGLLCSHLRAMTRRLREMSDEQWDWTPDVAAPTARILAAHAFQTLYCDRQHIDEYNALLHPLVPEVPRDTQAMCDMLAEETDRWEKLILAMTPELLAEDRKQFDMSPWTVRDIICHMIQNSIYKHGQLSTLYFALGLDGTAPYDAPFPNPIYKALHYGEAVRAERTGESFETFRASFDGEGVSEPLLEAAYALLSTKIGRGIPIRATDTLEDVFQWSQPLNLLNMYGGVPVRWMVDEISKTAGAESLGSDAVLVGVTTVSDLVRAIDGRELMTT